MEPEGSWLFSQQSTTGPCPESDALAHFPKIYSNIIFPSMHRSSEYSFFQSFLLKFYMHFSSLPVHAHTSDPP